MLTRIIAWLLFLLALAGTLLGSDDVVGTLFTPARWPLLALAFLVGGYAFSRDRFRLALLCLVTMALVVVDVTLFLTRRARPPSTETMTFPRELRVLTYNLMHEGGNPAACLEAINLEKPDLLFAQEVTSTWKARLEKEEPQLVHRAVRPRGDEQGLAMFSRYPLDDEKLVMSDEVPVALCATMKVGEQRVAVCSVRLRGASLRFDGPGAFLGSFTADARARRADAMRLAVHLADRKGVDDVIIAGNFNMIDWEPLHRELRHTYVDVFAEVGSESGATYPNLVVTPSFPLLRLDYLFVRGAISPRSSAVIALTGSDHRAVRAVVGLP